MRNYEGVEQLWPAILGVDCTDILSSSLCVFLVLVGNRMCRNMDVKLRFPNYRPKSSLVVPNQANAGVMVNPRLRLGEVGSGDNL